MTILVISTVVAGDESQATEAASPFTDSIGNPAGTAILIGEEASAPVALIIKDACFRFQVPIDQGLTINSASLKVTAFSAGQTGSPVNTNIVAEAADNSAQLVNSNFPNYNGRPLTVGVAWALAAAGAWTDGSAQVSPDITAVIQAIIDRPGWVSGNSIHLFVQATGVGADASRRCRAFNVFGLGTTELTIDFEPPPPSLAKGHGAGHRRFSWF